MSENKANTSRHAEDKQTIFQPLEFKSGLKVKNRLFRSNMSGMFDDYNGQGSNARLNWEEQFARGGVGCIISSYTPVTVEGRILTRYAMIDDDDKIPFWKEVGRRIHKKEYEEGGIGCKFLMQLSHSGRQQDMGGVENLYKTPGSSTGTKDFFHGILCHAMDRGEIQRTVRLFANGAERARKAGLDGVELHGANGYLITQFLSSAINDRRDEYGGSVANRTRFVLEIVRAIRERVGSKFHLQMKINAEDHNNWLPIYFQNKGNVLDTTYEICNILEDGGDGVDAFHVSSGSTFPHPRNPPGDFPILEARRWYDVMINQGVRGGFNYRIFHNKIAAKAFRWLWNRKRGSVIEGINANYAHEIRKRTNVPVIVTGGFQHASVIAHLIRHNWCDGVTIARPLIANPDLPKIFETADGPPTKKECTYCNRCLLNDIENPLGCYEITRYDGDTFEERYERMMESVMSVFSPPTYPLANSDGIGKASERDDV